MGSQGRVVYRNLKGGKRGLGEGVILGFRICGKKQNFLGYRGEIWASEPFLELFLRFLVKKKGNCPILGTTLIQGCTQKRGRGSQLPQKD